MSNYQKTTVAVIIAIAVVLSITSFWDEAVIVDEVPHIGSGYSYLKKGDFRLNPEHPPLAKDMAAIPLLFTSIDDRTLFQTRFWQEDINGQWEFGRFMIFSAAEDPQKVSRLAKFPMLIFYILSAILIFAWTRRRYGDFAGFTALILFLFSPTVIAHARFVTTDLPAAFGVLFSTYFFIKYLENPSRKNFWLSSVFFGIALLTKFSTFLLIPFLGFIALVYGWLKDNQNLEQKVATTIAHGVKALIIFIVGFIIIVYPIYFLHTMNYPPERQYNDTREILNTFGKRYLADPVVWASDNPVLRPAAQYGLGLLMVVQRSAGGNTVYFRGEVERFGWRSYFPTVYLIKEPLAWWALVIIALAAIMARVKNLKLRFKNMGEWIREHFVEFSMLTWLAIYWYTSITSTLNIGVRHLLPVFPFTIILISGQLALVRERIRFDKVRALKRFTIFTLGVALLLGWHVYENIRVYPYYLTYFNQIAGGSQEGYKIVVDSNYDWGQDLKRFSDWVKENDIRKIDFDYFGWADQTWYLGERLNWISSRTYSDLEDFKLRNPSDGWIAVSASFLMGSRGQDNGDYGWLREQTPHTRIGNSIFVYYLK